MAFSCIMTQALWLSKYFKEIRLLGPNPIVIHTNNSRSIAISTNSKNHCCMKHINVHYHFIKEQAQSNDIVFQYVPTPQNLTDFLTNHHVIGPGPQNFEYCSSGRVLNETAILISWSYQGVIKLQYIASFYVSILLVCLLRLEYRC